MIVEDTEVKFREGRGLRSLIMVEKIVLRGGDRKVWKSEGLGFEGERRGGEFQVERCV